MNTTAGQTLLDRVTPLVEDNDPDGVGVALCDSAGAMLGGLDDLVQDTDAGPGWSPVFDPDRAPVAWLPWTADFYGVDLIIGSSEQDQRDLIREQPAQHDGRPDTIRSAVLKTLTGPSPLVRIVERPGDAYAMTVITRTSETPDPTATAAAALSQKPAGIFPFLVIQSDEPIIDEGTRVIDLVTVDIDLPPTLADVT